MRGPTPPLTNAQGEQWANLCTAHYKEYQGSVGGMKGIISTWVKASGGAKKLAELM